MSSSPRLVPARSEQGVPAMKRPGDPGGDAVDTPLDRPVQGPVQGPEDGDVDVDTALSVLYAAHRAVLLRAAVLLVRDRATAEDLVQDAFGDMCRRWPTLRDPDRAAAYLRTAVVNRSRSALRHRAVVDRHGRREGPPPTAPGADTAALATVQRAEVLDALAALPRRQREVLVLRHYLDLSEAEIAESLGIRPGSVKTHASRGAAALRDRLSALADDREVR